MRKIGIIGGLAWPSTVDYYRLLCTKANEHFRALGHGPPFPTPPIVLESLNIDETRSARGVDGDERSWQRYDGIFKDAFRRLEQAGAQIGFIASNTPHMRIHSIRKGLSLPIISILETTALKVSSLRKPKALVLGTPMTMRSTVYPETLSAHGIAALPALSAQEIDSVGRLIDVELYQGQIEGAKEQIVSLCKHHVGLSAKDVAVCLACTELPLAFPEHRDDAHFEVEGVQFVNTTVAHAEAVLAEALSERTSE